jgi:hypothetical protein
MASRLHDIAKRLISLEAEINSREQGTTRKRLAVVLPDPATCKNVRTKARARNKRLAISSLLPVVGRMAFNARTWLSQQAPGVRCTMRISHFEFGVLEIDGVSYEHDVVIDHGEIQKRKKKASKKFRDAFGHTPLSLEEDIPWRCRRLIIGTGAYGRLPVMDDVKREADERGVKLIVLPTAEAIEVLQKHPRETNAVLHVTC